MENIIEEQYQKIIETFPDAIIVDNYIFHVKIPLVVNDVYLDINFKKYPKKPKVIWIKSNGETYKNLGTVIRTLLTWKKKNAPPVVELINEILAFVNMMQTNEIGIEAELLDGLLALCRQQHPREILGLLRIDKGIFTEFILPPGAITSDTSGVFFPSRLPMDSTIEGSVHSHPTGNITPSIQDLASVFQKNRFNFIIGYPYNSFSCVKCFDKRGNEILFRIVN